MRIWPVELHGRFVRLTPMTLDDVDGLIAAAAEDRATYGFTSVPDSRDAMVEQVESLVRQRDRGHEVPFTTRDATDGRVLGSTRFLWLRSYFDRDEPDAVEIGGTWLAASAQRTRINTEAKYLLLSNAFDHWNVHRVSICTDSRNTQSRTAILRIGATFEGILRSHRGSYAPGEENTVARDSAMYSVIRSDWPAIKTQLEERLQ